MAFADELRGMYALALHDRAARQVVLARDPFGIKPLYIAEVEGGVAFASEPQALVAAGLVRPRVRREALAELLQIQFTTGAETIFEGVSRVLPGETVAIADGAVAERRRRAALPEGGPESIEPDAALARFDAAFEESVALHQRSDVPYGMFLSGGTDSAAVLAMMARLNESPVTAFTAGFDVPGAADERAAAAVAAARGRRAARHRVGGRGRGLAPPAGDRRLRGRPGRRLRHHPHLVPRPPRAGGGEGGALRRGRRRDARRLRPLPRRHAPLVAGRQGAALPRLLRPAGRRAARAAHRLARRHRRRRGRRRHAGPHAARRRRRRSTWRTGCRTTC